GTRVAAGAGRAATALLDRPQVLLVLRIADADHAGTREIVAVAGVPGGHHAIEHVHAARDRLHQVLRPADTHEVARAVPRQLRTGVFEPRVAFVLRLADGQAADGVAVE